MSGSSAVTSALQRVARRAALAEGVLLRAGALGSVALTLRDCPCWCRVPRWLDCYGRAVRLAGPASQAGSECQPNACARLSMPQITAFASPQHLQGAASPSRGTRRRRCQPEGSRRATGAAPLRRRPGGAAPETPAARGLAFEVPCALLEVSISMGCGLGAPSCCLATRGLPARARQVGLQCAARVGIRCCGGCASSGANTDRLRVSWRPARGSRGWKAPHFGP